MSFDQRSFLAELARTIDQQNISPFMLRSHAPPAPPCECSHPGDESQATGTALHRHRPVSALTLVTRVKPPAPPCECSHPGDESQATGTAL
ncbi:hypothetical protein RRG08_011571, partial [Elysia crispata]